MSQQQVECSGYYPLAIGSVRGVRVFGVDDLGRLRGAYKRRHIWTPDENEASCHPESLATIWYSTFSAIGPPFPAPETREQVDAPQKHEVVDAGCGCGFYAYHDGVSDYDVGTAWAESIHGVIEGYGRTTIGRRGFRCAKARIVALCIPEPKPGKKPTPKRLRRQALMERVRENYAGIPAFRTVPDMLAAHPVDRDVAPTPDSDVEFWTRP